MLFNSLQFLFFFPVVTLIYFIIPSKVKYLWLLISSYYFYMCWNAKYALLMLFSTAVTYVCSLMIEAVKEQAWEEDKKIKYKKYIVVLSLILNLSVLGYFKYTNFLIDLLVNALGRIHIAAHIPKFDILLPVGISFYTFQALSYTMDVYRGDVYAEKNFFRYALFVSFFPQLVAGPIERSKNLLRQLASPKQFSFDNTRKGFLLMLWGYFLKVVLADRIAYFVDTVYGYYSDFDGLILVAATVLFAFQIYCDFYGYSVIATGAAKVLGIDLMENFHSPYLTFSVAEFWRRWHISLTSWFKDYLYFPLGGSRKGKIRKYVNKMVVFLVSGLWHGAGFSFVVWGLLNGLYQIIEEVLKPLRMKLPEHLKIRKENVFYKAVQLVMTFILVDFAWIFFRANSITDAVHIIRRMLTVDMTSFSNFAGNLYAVGMYKSECIVIFVSLLVLLFSDICKCKNISIIQKITETPWFVQSAWVVVAICTILVFGIWGPEYNQANFIYFQF